MFKGEAASDAHRLRMDAGGWLSLIEAAVRARLPDVEISRPDVDMLTLALGTRGTVLQATGGTVIIAPSFAVGGTLGSWLANRCNISR